MRYHAENGGRIGRLKREKPMILGIDVSHFQGTINWQALAQAGLIFAIIKAGGSEGGKHYRESAFERNYAEAHKYGVQLGAYYVVGKQCHTSTEGNSDAQHFASLLVGKKFEYPVYIDFEVPSVLTKKGNTDATIAFCKYMESVGYYVGIYASDISGFKSRLELNRLTAFDKWVARYGSAPQYVTSYGMWQWTDAGAVVGIKGRVDMNASFKDYPAIMVNKHLNGY